VAEHGVRRVAPWLAERGLSPDHVLVGEPSSSQSLGDAIRIGRRGSIQARLVVDGVQGHTAYADPTENPVHRAAPFLADLVALEFDDADASFPATRLQVSNVAAGTGADNVTPGRLEVLFNLRHNPNSSADRLQRQVRDLISRHDLDDAELTWRISGAPFGPAGGKLLDAVRQALVETIGTAPECNTGGGTSDGRFFGPDGIETVELGPVNRTIHRVDEAIALADLDRLPVLYESVIRRVLA
jgi:succinyl-diaminopimelate desuccinylase